MNQEQQSSQSAVESSEAMIRGAAAIAEYMFGDRRFRRRVYHLVQTSRIPIARIGSTLCLRPSTYQKWIESQEARALIDPTRKT
jgi:hypothetical protein